MARLRAVAESGVLVAAIDLTLAPEAPLPASGQDANYGKAHEMVKSFIARYLGSLRRAA
jgi:acetyl esterase/lipase